MNTCRFLMVLLTLSILFVPGTSRAADSDEAVVTRVTLPMHADKTTDSSVLRVLQGGDIVTVEYEIEGSGGSWCFINLKGTTAMGYVPCDGLTRKSKSSLWNRLNDKVNDKVNSKANRRAAERNSGQNSNVRVLLYMTEW